MTKELKNLILFLKSPIKENRDLGVIVAQNYEEEFKAHFGFGMKLIEFIFIMKDGYSNKSEIHKCVTKELENLILLLKSPRKKIEIWQLSWQKIIKKSLRRILGMK